MIMPLIIDTCSSFKRKEKKLTIITSGQDFILGYDFRMGSIEFEERMYPNYEHQSDIHANA